LIGTTCIGTFTAASTTTAYLDALTTYVCNGLTTLSGADQTDLYDYESISTHEDWIGIGGDSGHSSSSLIVPITSNPSGVGRYYINGIKYKVANQNVTLVASRDNYVDWSESATDYVITDVASGSTAPPVSGVRLWKFVTDGSGVTAATDLRNLYWFDGERMTDNAVLTRHITDLNVTAAKLENFGTAGTNDWGIGQFTVDDKGRVQSYSENVTLNSLANGDVLQYNSSTSTWENVGIAATLIPAGATQGQTLYYDTSSSQYQVSTFLRNMDNAVGIGGSGIPQQELHIGASATQAWQLDDVSGLNASTTTGGSLVADTYYYTVTAIDSLGGESISQNEVSGTVDGIAQTQVDITWAEVPRATSYRVYKGTASGVYTEYFSVTGSFIYSDTGAAGTAGSAPTENPSAFAMYATKNGIGIGATADAEKAIVIRDNGFSTHYGVDILLQGTKNVDTYGVKSSITATNSANNIGGWFNVSGGANNYVLRLQDGNDNTGKFLQVSDADGNVAFNDPSVTIQDEGASILAGANVINFVGPGVTASSPSAGQVDVSITGSVSALDDLSDVTSASPNDWDTLAYDSALSQWVNSGVISNDLDNAAIGDKPTAIAARLHINSTNGTDLLKIENSIAGVVATINSAGLLTYNDAIKYTYTNSGASPLGAGKVLTSDANGNATWENANSSINLQSVTNIGNATTNNIELTGSSLVYDNSSFTTTVSANPTANRTINFPDESGYIVLGSGTTDRVTRWDSASSTGNSSFYDDGTTTGFGVTPSASKRIDIVSNVDTTIEIDHTGSAAGSCILDMSYTGTASGIVSGLVKLSSSSAVGSTKGIVAQLTSSTGTYVYGVQGNVNNAANRNCGVYGSANNAQSGGKDIGVLAAANNANTTFSYVSVGLSASSSAPSTNAGDAAGIWCAATVSNSDDNYGIHIKTANPGTGTSYIGIFDDGRTTGANKYLKSIDANGVAEWASITASSLGVTLSSTSSGSTTTSDSLYTMTSGIDVEYRTNGGVSLFYMDESDSKVGIGTNSPTSTLSVNGSAEMKLVTTSSASYTAGDEVTIYADTTSNNVTVNLPTASGIDGRIYVVKKKVQANKIIIDANSSETIDGSTTQELFDQYDWITIQSDGTSWIIIG
tara:strand:+ start:9390 stop:12782 length:3393 start_codon:yes stop_codon:yes gene_type:complete